MGSFKQLPYLKNEHRRISSTYNEFKNILGLKTFAAEWYDKLFYEYRKRKDKGEDEKILTSPAFVAKTLNCSIRSAWGIFKKYTELGFVKISKTSNIEVKEGCLLNYSVTILKFPTLYDVNRANPAQICETPAQICETPAQTVPSSALIDQGFTEISDSPTVLQHITTYINPLSPLNENIPKSDNLDNIPATANALAGELEKPKIEKPLNIQQLTLESVLSATAEPPPVSKKTRRKIDYEDSFEQWWMLYPVHKNKEKSFRKFKGALKKIPFDALMEATKVYIDIREKEIENNPRKSDSHTYTPHPETWLNNQRWEDEPVQIELEKRKAKTLPGTYQPSSEEIKIMSKSEFDRRVKEVLVKILPKETYKSWIEGTGFEAIGFGEFNDLEFKTNSKFSEDYIQSHFNPHLERSFNEAKTSLQQDNYAIH